MPEIAAPAVPSRSKALSIFWVLLVIPGTVVFLCLIVASSAWNAGFRSFVVPSSAMEPTIMQGDHIIASMHYYLTHAPKDRDIILFRRGKIIYIKRVIASPGETVQGSAGNVYVNGVLQTEPYVQHTGKALDWMNDFGPIEVARGEYFVMGDNRDVSFDSRAAKFGCVTAASIVGKAVRVLFNPRSKRIGKVI